MRFFNQRFSQIKIPWKNLSFFFLFSILISCLILGCSEQNQTISKKTVFQPEFSVAGSIVFQSNLDGDNEIFLITGQKVTQLTNNDWNDEFPVWSPNGDKIAFTANPDGNYDIFIMNADGGNKVAITDDTDDEKEPGWFPDGKGIIYTREEKRVARKRSSLFSMDLQSKATKRIIPQFTKHHGIAHISPADPILVFTGKRTIGWDVALFNMVTDKFEFLIDGGKSCRARFSKDGKKLAYVNTKDDGKGEIWIMMPDGSKKERLTERTETYDYFPTWSPDGNYIAFNTSSQHDIEGDWKLCVMDVNTKKVSILFDSPGNDVFPDWH